MKVLIISKYATPKLYPRHFNLGKGLVSKGYNVTLVASTSNRVGSTDVPKFRGLYKITDYDGLRVVWFKGPSISNKGISRIVSWILFEIQCLLLFKGYNIVYTSSLSLLSVYNGIIRKYLLKSKWILEIRDVWPKSAILLGGYSKLNLGIKFLYFTEKIGYKRCDELIGTMPNFKHRVVNELGLKRDVHFLPQGVDLNILEKERLEIDAQFKAKYLPENRFIVCYVGTMNANNPLNELLVFIENLPVNLRKRYWFMFLGRGENKTKIESRLKRFDNVVFPDPVDKRFIPSILKYCHVGYDSISVELATYGLSRNKWIDYLFCGIPIVCVYEGYKSILKEYNVGTYVEHNNFEMLLQAMEYYRCLDSSERSELSARAKSYILKHHSYEILTNKLEKLF